MERTVRPSLQKTCPRAAVRITVVPEIDSAAEHAVLLSWSIDDPGNHITAPWLYIHQVSHINRNELIAYYTSAGGFSHNISGIFKGGV